MPLPRVTEPNRKFLVRPWWLAVCVATLVLLVTALNQGPALKNLPAPVVPPSVYPMSGYFVSSSLEDSKNYQKLLEIKSLGADTAITFGVSLLPATADTLPADCIIDGENCAKVAGSGLKINRYFTFSDGSQWGPSAVKCPGDRSLVSEGKSYTVLVFPAAGDGCTAKDGRYDIVVAGGSKTTAADPAVSLAAAATKLGMKFYAGMPAPVKRTDFEYLPDLSYQNTLKHFTERFLQYQAKVNNVPGLAGFYHHLEMPVSDSSFFDPVLSVYSMQNQAIHQILPTRSAIVSPYIEARRDTSFITPQNAKDGARKIAQTASGLHLDIAIQDGMGTGKGAAYLPSESKLPVDKFAASIVGNGTWSSKYAAPTGEYFRAASAGVVGLDAEVWANLEGMAPATEANPCEQSRRGQTTMARIDRQLQQMASTAKIISYMWDPYYTCTGAEKPLKDQMARGFSTPIITDSQFDPATGVMTVTGFNVTDSSLTIEWAGPDGKEQSLQKPPTVEPASGKKQGLNPRVEMATLTLDGNTPRPDATYTLSISNPWTDAGNVAFQGRVSTAGASR